MTDLAEVLGTLLASVAKARHITDLQTASIAEQYRENPLLEGLSVPRVRVPELRIDLPVLIEGEREGVPGRLHEPEFIARKAVTAIHRKLTAAGVKLPKEVRQRLIDQLSTGLAQEIGPHVTAAREAIARRAEQLAHDALASTGLMEQLNQATLRAILNAVRRRVEETAEAEPGRRPTMSVNVISGELKERASPSVVARLSLSIREEGLEWEITRNADGTTTRRLGPE